MLLNFMLLINGSHSPFFVVFWLLFDIIHKKYACIISSIYWFLKIWKFLLFYIDFSRFCNLRPVSKRWFPLLFVESLFKSSPFRQVLSLKLDLAQKSFVVIKLLLLLSQQCFIFIWQLLIHVNIYTAICGRRVFSRKVFFSLRGWRQLGLVA